MNVDEMILAINSEIEIYLDKLRIFHKGNQVSKMYEWIKRDYQVYAENYAKILFEGNEEYYTELVKKYLNHKE